MIYELRTYMVKPDKMDELLLLWEREGKPIIDKYMKVLGIWTTDIGPLNQVVHLYAWDDLTQRERARKAFYALPESKVYVAKVKKLYDHQECKVMTAVHFSPPLFKE